ncbi:DUF5666 domain-containing protein [Beijerinckia mobilis]|uniref:DUF5666 domain-containing protein n=1 Tax=Beijerinckia mobilis TaxID=231434 RepID=UPI00069039BA|nr:DUF5666 domain-containing protein [Beijerinckia mobilis]
MKSGLFLLRRDFTRRDWLTHAATSVAALLMARGEGISGPRDQGIGGTGVTESTGGASQGGSSSSPLGDRGIGGTGVVGTIRRFGSIYVNGLRITYPEQVTVKIDGMPARPSDLKLGQVVRVLAREEGSVFSTGRIDVASEVVGPVGSIQSRKSMSVLGQKVSTIGLSKNAKFRVGDTVAVSGLRRPDGTIVASLVEPRAPDSQRITGPVERDADGLPRIGDLRLSGLDPALIGRRAVISGEMSGDAFKVRSAAPESALFDGRPSRLSLETYVERDRGGRLRFGSGWDLQGGHDLVLPQGGGPQRAVVVTQVDSRGQAVIDAIHPITPSGLGPGHMDQGHFGQGQMGRGPSGQGPNGYGSAGHGLNGPGGQPAYQGGHNGPGFGGSTQNGFGRNGSDPRNWGRENQAGPMTRPLTHPTDGSGMNGGGAGGFNQGGGMPNRGGDHSGFGGPNGMRGPQGPLGGPPTGQNGPLDGMRPNGFNPGGFDPGGGGGFGGGGGGRR